MIRKQEISIPFTQGVDTKLDEKLTMSPTEIINSKIGKDGILKKVNGVKVETKTIAGLPDLAKAKNISTFNGSMLLADDTSFLEKSENATAWGTTSRLQLNSVSADFINRYSGVDSAYVEDSDYAIYTSGNGLFIKTKSTMKTFEIKANDTGDELFVAAQVGASIGYFRKFSTSLFWAKVVGGTLQAEVLVKTVSIASQISIATSASGAYLLTGNANVELFEIDDSGSILSTATLSQASTNGDNLCVQSDDSSVYVLYSDSAGEALVYEKFNLSLSTSETSYNFLAGAKLDLASTIGLSSEKVVAIYTYFLPNDNTVHLVSSELKSTAPTQSLFEYSSYEPSPFGSANTGFRLYGKGFSPNGKSTFTLVEAVSPLDRKLFVIDEFLNIQSTILNSNLGSNGGGFSVGLHRRILSEIKIYDNVSRFTIPESDKGQLLVNVNFLNPVINSVNFTNVKLFSGGNPIVYDGQEFFPASFSSDPTIESVASSGVGTITGSFDYKIIHSMIDNRGNKYRSGDSPKASITVTNADKINVVMNSPIEAIAAPLSGFGVSYSIELYRKLSTETVYKLVSVGAVTLSGLAGNEITGKVFFDSVTDISSEEALYVTDETTSTLRNATLPPLKDIVWNNGRILGISSLDNEVVYSRKYVIGEGVNFPLEFKFVVEDNQTKEAEEIAALGVLDSKLIIFKKSSLLAVYGDGPDNNGENSDFTDPEIISTDAGSENPLSIVLTGTGLFFQSEKGIYKLDRSLALTFTGKEVEKITTTDIVSALNNQNDDEVIFHTKDGHEIFYNYFFNAWTWSEFKGSFVSAASLDGKIVTVDETGQVLTENETFRKGTEFIENSFNTGWLKLKGIQDFQRVSRLIFEGEYIDDHQLKIEVFYDYENTLPDEYIISPQIGERYQFSVHLKRQKCQAMRVKVTCVDTGATQEGFRMSDMTILAGIKKGNNKLPSGRKY